MAEYRPLTRQSSELDTEDEKFDEPPIAEIYSPHLIGNPTLLRDVLLQWTLDLGTSLRQALPRIGLALLPSYTQRWITGTPPEADKLHAIGVLDGLRGFACLFVFHFHMTFTYTTVPMYGYGYNKENSHVMQLPFIKILYAGHSMVAVFFVISGYVLSHKPLKLMRTRSWDQLQHTLTSSVFRRGMRLYLPTFAGTFIVMLAVRAGLFRYSTTVRNDGVTMQGVNEQHPIYYATFREQLRSWGITATSLVDPFNYSVWYNDYDPHLWTIQVEFRSSLALFITLVGCARLRTPYRIAVMACLLGYCVWWDRWAVLLFLSGMFVAEIDLATGLFTSTPLLDASTPLKQRPFVKSFRRVFWVLIFILGVYFASSPSWGPEHTPGYQYLTSIIPRYYTEKYKFWQSMGAILIVWSCTNSKDVQPLFTNRVGQYLGKISYAFYIVHGPVQHSLGYTLMFNFWKITGKETMFGYCLAYFLTWLIVFPIVLWLADLFWRALDIPSVQFAKWVETKTLSTTPRN